MKFEAGNTYSVSETNSSFGAAYETVHTFKVLKRTAKFVTVEGSWLTEPVRVSIKTDEDGEYCKPLGDSYITPRLRA